MTFPALGLFFAGRYFQHGYHCLEAQQWLEIARACFTLQSRAAKPWENCNGYGWLVPYHTLRYSLATGDPTYFENSNVRLQADYAILTMDNLGYQVPYGDTGSYQCWWTEFPTSVAPRFIIATAAGPGRWKRSWPCIPTRAWRSTSATAAGPGAERPCIGTRRAIALDKMYWESVNGRS